MLQTSGTVLDVFGKRIRGRDLCFGQQNQQKTRPLYYIHII